jgi:hypothetical protein
LFAPRAHYLRRLSKNGQPGKAAAYYEKALQLAQSIDSQSGVGERKGWRGGEVERWRGEEA